jgi:hypothetical protein
MGRDIQISSVDKDGGDGVIVAFSDGTIGAYVAEELLKLRPHRELIHELQELPQIPAIQY